MANYIKPVSRWGVVRSVFLTKWVALVMGAFTIIGALDFVDTHVIPHAPALKTSWDRYYVLPHWPWYWWAFLIAVALILTSIEGAYRFAKHYYEVALRID